MDEPPARVMLRIGRLVDQAIQAHECRCHAVPPPDHSPVSSVPFPNVQPSDDLVCHAIELLHHDGLDEALVARLLDVPLPALLRALADYHSRYARFLRERANR